MNLRSRSKSIRTRRQHMMNGLPNSPRTSSGKTRSSDSGFLDHSSKIIQKIKAEKPQQQNNHLKSSKSSKSSPKKGKSPKSSPSKDLSCDTSKAEISFKAGKGSSKSNKSSRSSKNAKVEEMAISPIHERTRSATSSRSPSRNMKTRGMRDKDSSESRSFIEVSEGPVKEEVTYLGKRHRSPVSSSKNSKRPDKSKINPPFTVTRDVPIEDLHKLPPKPEYMPLKFIRQTSTKQVSVNQHPLTKGPYKSQKIVPQELIPSLTVRRAPALPNDLVSSMNYLLKENIDTLKRVHAKEEAMANEQTVDSVLALALVQTGTHNALKKVLKWVMKNCRPEMKKKVEKRLGLKLKKKTIAQFENEAPPDLPSLPQKKGPKEANPQPPEEAFDETAFYPNLMVNRSLQQIEKIALEEMLDAS